MPYKPRPQTSASVARRMVSGALGMRMKVDDEQRKKELAMLRDAKGKRDHPLCCAQYDWRQQQVLCMLQGCHCLCHLMGVVSSGAKLVPAECLDKLNKW